MLTFLQPLKNQNLAVNVHTLRVTRAKTVMECRAFFHC